MKTLKITKLLSMVSIAAALLAGNALATPITFTPDPAGSSVIVTDNAPLATMSANLVLSSNPFVLNDGDKKTLDFFTLTATGLAFDRDYRVEATLNFSSPSATGEASGGGQFSTIFGAISGGNLTWDSGTLPDIITLADGNTIGIDFESGCVFGFGNTALVHAYVRNLGGGTAPVPEPGSMVLLGAGLVGLVIFGKRRMSQA